MSPKATNDTKIYKDLSNPLIVSSLDNSSLSDTFSLQQQATPSTSSVVQVSLQNEGK